MSDSSDKSLAAPEPAPEDFQVHGGDQGAGDAAFVEGQDFGVSEPPLLGEEPDTEPDEATVRLYVETPFWSSGFVFADEERGTLVVTREGTDVPESLVDTLTEAAAKSGVNLARSE